MTKVEKNYNFHDETMKDLQVLVTNNTTRKVLHNELVYFDDYFGEVVELDGIAASAKGRINIYPYRVIRTEQVQENDDFTPGEVVWFKLQTNDDPGELLDDKPNSITTQIAVGKIIAGGDSGYVEFRPFVQNIDFSMIMDDGELVAACVATTAAIKGESWTDDMTVKGNYDEIATLKGNVSAAGSVLKAIKDEAEDATYDPSGSSLTAETLKLALDEAAGRIDTAEVNPVRTVALVVDEPANDTHVAFANSETGLGAGDKIIDVHIVCTDGDSEATLALYQMGDGPALGDAISSAMACTTENALARTTSIDQAENEVTEYGLAVVAGNELDRGIVYVTYIKATE